MFTPQEIQEQTFSKAVFGGYDMQQVDDFLEPLTEDYITLYKENSVLKAKMKILVEKLEEYRAQETQQSSATAEAEAKSAQLLKQTQAKCAAMLQNAEVNARPTHRSTPPTSSWPSSTSRSTPSRSGSTTRSRPRSTSSP